MKTKTKNVHRLTLLAISLVLVALSLTGRAAAQDAGGKQPQVTATATVTNSIATTATPIPCPAREPRSVYMSPPEAVAGSGTGVRLSGVDLVPISALVVNGVTQTIIVQERGFLDYADFEIAADTPSSPDPANVVISSCGRTATYSGFRVLPFGSTSTPTYTPTSTSTPTATPTPCTAYFSDVPYEHVFREDIYDLACQGIISGYPDGTFRPAQAVRRGEMSKVLVGSFGFGYRRWSNLSYEAEFSYSLPLTPYSDLNADSIFYTQTMNLSSNWVVTGYSDGSFRPNVPVTRGQFAKVIAIARGYPLLNPAQPTFADVTTTSFYYPYVETLYLRGIIVGGSCAGGNQPCFRPNESLSRGEMARFVRFALNAGAVPPATPSEFSYYPQRYLIWRDNADNEQGFLLITCAHPSGKQCFGARVELIPPHLGIGLSTQQHNQFADKNPQAPDCGGSVDYILFTFNAIGDSERVYTSSNYECD